MSAALPTPTSDKEAVYTALCAIKNLMQRKSALSLVKQLESDVYPDPQVKSVSKPRSLALLMRVPKPSTPEHRSGASKEDAY